MPRSTASKARGAHRRQPPGEVRGVGGHVGDRLLPGQPAERRQRFGRRGGGPRTGRQGPEVGLGLGEGGLGIAVTHDRQHRVVGHVVGGEERRHVLNGGGVQILHRADHGVPVRVVRREGQLDQPAHRVAVRNVVVPLALLLLDHLALVVQVRLGEGVQQAAQPVGLQPQRQVQAAGGQGLEVVGPVEPGGGVDRGAGGLQQRRCARRTRRSPSLGTSRARRGARTRSGRAARAGNRRRTRG